MKTIKPDHQALLTRTLHWQGRDLLSVGLVALFDLKNPAIGALRAEADLWKLWPQATGTPPMLDEGYPKPRAEFMAYGEACAPQGRAVPQLVLSAQVGEVRKSLLVQGERRWNALGLATAAKPFVRLPMVAAHAFGGPQQAANPLGQGADETVLPQIEDPRHPVAHPSDRPEPAGFWGVDASAPRRQKALGATDAAWLRTQWPALPQDTQADFFQSAPADQRGAAAWRGNETVALLHWDADQPQIESRLPGLRARCFAQRLTPQGETVFEEMPAHAETVWLLPGLGCGAVLYRATLALTDPDALDVTHLMADWEALDSAPLPAQVYRDRLLPPAQPVAVEAPAVDAAPAAKTVVPELLGAAATVAAAGAAVAAVVQASAKPASPLQSLMDKVLKGQPLTEADARALASAAPEDAPEISDAHIQALTTQMLDQRDALLAEHGLSESDVSDFLKARGASAEAIQLGGMTRAEMEASFKPPASAAAAPAASAAGAAASAASAAPAVALLQPLMDKVLLGEPLTEDDVRALASAAPEDAPQVSDAHLQAMTKQMLDQRDTLLAEHGLNESDVSAFLKERGASAEAIRLGGMSRAAMQAHFSATPAAAAAAAAALPAVAARAATPSVSPLQPLMDKVLLGQPLTDADARALSSAAPEHAPHISDAHLQAMTQQMLDQRDAVLAEHGLKESDVAAFLKERGASAEAIQLGGMTRAQMQSHFGVAGASVASLAAGAAAPAAAAPAAQSAPAAPGKDGSADPKAAASAPDAPRAAPSAAPTPASIAAAPGPAPAQAASGSPAPAAHAASAASAVSSGASAVSAAAPLAAALASAAAPGPAAPASAAQAPPVQAPPEAAAEPRVWTRETVQAHHAQAGSFKGEDLSGLDLSKLDLSGADFSEAQLEKTHFNGSRLAGARFDRAQMPQADLSGIDGAQASFAQARAASAVLAGAQLGGAVLDAADFHGADFSRASLAGASGARADFQKARMGGLSASGLRAAQALFDGCDLAGADLREAALEGARFNEAALAGARLGGIQGTRSEWFGVQATGADFSGAQLAQARGGGGAVFTQANFEGANLTGAVWDGVNLQRASLRGAQLAGADFSGAQLEEARLEGADARGANFSRTQLAGAQAAQTNFMGASLRRADLARVSLPGSNLHGSDLEGVHTERSDLRGALTTATLLTIDGRPEAQGVIA